MANSLSVISAENVCSVKARLHFFLDTIVFPVPKTVLETDLGLAKYVFTFYEMSINDYSY